MTTAEQGTDAWVQARLGKLTASRMHDAVRRTKTGWSEYRRAYMIELIAERLTGMARKSYLSEAMLWGIETEPQALAVYQKRRGLVTQPGCFVEHPFIPMTGATPDAFVDEDGLVEIKCPDSHTHVGYLIDRMVPEQYIAQTQWQLACTERKWCDFCSFDPRMPPDLRLLVVRVERVPEIIEELETLACEFLKELDEALAMIKGERHASSEDIAASLEKPSILVRKK